jgi:hypothetical protein
MPKNLLNYVFVAIVAALLGILIYQSTGINPDDSMPMDKVGDYAIDFIKNELASPEMEFIVGTTTEENGLYRVEFEVMGQKDSAYVTKNGKYLFFQPYDMKPPKPKEIPQAEKPKIDLFVMSYCPYGNQSENLIMPVVDLLGDKTDIELHYIIYNNYQTGYPDYCLDEENLYCSMHGVEEVKQNIRELCVQKYQPDKFWSFIEEVNNQTTAEDIEEKWEGIASSVGIDTGKIKTCQADEALTLLEQEVNLTNQKYPVQDPKNHQSQEEMQINGSPTLVINGMVYDGERTSNGYKEAICSAFNNPPAECNQELTDSGSAAAGMCE